MEKIGDVTSLIRAMQQKSEQRLVQRARESGVPVDEQERVEREEYDRKREEFELEAERKQRRGALEFARAPITPEDSRRIIYRDYDQTRAVRSCVGFVAQERVRFLFLCGPNGVGKTFASACAVASVGRGIFVRSRHLPEAMRPWSREEGRGFDPRTEPMIVLEELGMEDPRNDRWRDAWFEFVDDRQARGHTIITTNLTKKDVLNRFEGRIRDRLEASSFIFELSGESRRQKLRVVK